MQTTHAKVVPYQNGFPGYGFVNEPYPFTRAGGHPDAITSALEFSSEELGKTHTLSPTRDAKDMIIDLPPGLTADPTAVPRCPRTLAVSTGSCPADSQVGVFVLRFGEKAMLGPIVDVVPEAGEAATLGLETPLKVMFLLSGRIIRTPRGYGLALVGRGLPLLSVLGVETTLWGVPAAAVHDPQRQLSCTAINVDEQWGCNGGNTPSGVAPLPFLTMPSDCSAGPLSAELVADSWQEPGRYVHAGSSLPGMTDCNELPFAPEVEVRPDTLLADEPVGLSLRIGIPQSEGEQAAGTPPLRSASVTLAQGISISPGVADGLRACEASGPEGFDMPSGLSASGVPLQPDEVGEGEEIGPSGEPHLAAGHCPEASTLGSVEALTPLLPGPLQGRIYLAEPRCGGAGQAACGDQDALDGNLYRLYLELGGRSDSHDYGVNIKLEGEVRANTATGQLTVKLDGNPQLPIGQLSISLNGGPRALLDNPPNCGLAMTSSDMQPWSAPGITPAPESLLVAGTPGADPSSAYEVVGCGTPPPLDPALLAGTISPLAGAFSPLTLSISRGDREQYLSQIQLKTPPGLSALLSSVEPCEEALANIGRCPAASLIGGSLVASGAGSHPYEMPGDIYLTAGYEGAPFGLSIVTNAVAGPLNLGTVVIRARIEIDPQSAALTITSDVLPQVVLGVPLRLQRVTLNIDRPNFVLNPTDCNPLRLTATILGALGSVANASNGFAAGECKDLAFTPNLLATTSGRTSYGSGASLDLRLAFPKSTPGTEANLARVRVELPKQLPSRLTTLQGACPQSTFASDPAACPGSSIVGIARARTPVLSSELAGPVLFVAHGHDAPPSPVVVLQGEGVRFTLTGSTLLTKAGTADIAFSALPDVPIESLEVYLPEGPHSVLAANANLCALSRTVTIKATLTKHLGGHTVRRLVKLRRRVPASVEMPTELLAQNGAVIHRSTKIEVSGCPSRSKATRRG
jgi:hypothetical protein